MFNLLKRHKTGNDGQHAATGSLLPEYDIISGLKTDVGCVREVNEDSGKYVYPNDPHTLATKGVLFIVADGMGGHTAGEVASSTAVDIVSDIYYSDGNDPTQALKRAFREANKAIHNASQDNEELSGMGTTCTALVLLNNSAIAAHVGDSRIYLVREGEIYVMTEDHSAVMEMVKRGWITQEQARYHPDKNVILRAMGTQSDIDVATWEEPFPVKTGDRFLLCSDGLYDLVEDAELKDAVLNYHPQRACEHLVNVAKERGGHDNITVGILSLAPENERPVPETREVEGLR